MMGDINVDGNFKQDDSNGISRSDDSGEADTVKEINEAPQV